MQIKLRAARSPLLSFFPMNTRKLLSWLVTGTIFVTASPAQAQLLPGPTPSINTETSVSTPVTETTTVTTESSSSTIKIEVTTTGTTQTDIFEDPITTLDSPAEPSPDLSATDPDAYGPVTSNITISSITPVGAVIAWTTDEIADSQIEYGLADAYGFETTLNVVLGTAHIQTLSNLQPGTDYHFRVKSKDTAGNVTISEDQIFTTVSAPLVLDIPPVILTQNVASVMETLSQFSGRRMRSRIPKWNTDSGQTTDLIRRSMPASP